MRFLIPVFVVILTGCCTTSSTLLAKATSDSEMSIGVSAISLKDKKVVFVRDDRKLFTPSSTAKILTTAAALHYLGPAYRFDTAFYASARKGAQIDDLILKASGDPDFSSKDLEKLVVELRQLGIHKINKNIVIDASIFDDVSYASGWMLSDMNEGWSAPISGISVDHNKIVFGLVASAKAGDQAGLTIFPNTSYFTIDNKAKTLASGPTKILLTHADTQGIKKGARVLVEGQIALLAPPKYDTLAINDPIDFAGNLIAEALKKNGIAFKGKIVRGVVPKEAELLTRHLSDPLSEMVINFMKMSNNHAAEMLVKRIAVAESGAPGTFANGLLAIRKFLETKANVILGNSITADGSGLSRYNQVSAKQLTDLLSYCWNDFRIGPEFVASLALFGEDGTLKNGKSTGLVGSVRAKTGSMTNLKSLAGYLKRDNGDIVAFAILTNGGGTARQQAAIEDILNALKKS